jgi:hypothetical protein
MFESKRIFRRSLPVVAVASLALTACGGSHEGLVGVDLLECSNGPRQNELILSSLPKNEEFQLGDSVWVNQHAESSGGVEVTSLGNGSFNVELQSGKVTFNGADIEGSNKDARVDIDLLPGNSMTYEEGGERYTLTASQQEPQLTISAACVD